MKRISLLLLFSLLFLSLTGCSGEPAKPSRDYVSETIAAIDAIGVVSDAMPLQPLEKEDAIKTADTLYKNLTSAQQKMVTNAAKLTEAKKILNKATSLRTEAQQCAQSMFKIFAKGLKNAETIKVKGAWYSTLDGKSNHHFTFQFEIENSRGVKETVYLSTSSPMPDMSGGTIGEWVGRNKFKQGATYAKNDGIKLDEYYIKKDLEAYLKR